MLGFINPTSVNAAASDLGTVLGEVGGEIINKGIDKVSGWFSGDEPATRSATLGGASSNIQASLSGLATSNAEILSKITNSVGSDGASDPSQLLEAQHMMQMRQQILSTITNIMKSLHEMMMSVIGNLRL